MEAPCRACRGHPRLQRLAPQRCIRQGPPGHAERGLHGRRAPSAQQRPRRGVGAAHVPGRLDDEHGLVLTRKPGLQSSPRRRGHPGPRHLSQPGLGGLGHAGHRHQHQRIRRPRRPRDVQHGHQLPEGVMDGGRVANKPVVALRIVRRAHHRDGGGLGQRGANGIRPTRGLIPAGAFHQPHVVGLSREVPARAARRQDDALPVREHRHPARRQGRGGEHLQHPPQLMPHRLQPGTALHERQAPHTGPLGGLPGARGAQSARALPARKDGPQLGAQTRLSVERPDEELLPQER